MATYCQSLSNFSDREKENDAGDYEAGDRDEDEPSSLVTVWPIHIDIVYTFYNLSVSFGISIVFNKLLVWSSLHYADDTEYGGDEDGYLPTSCGWSKVGKIHFHYLWLTREPHNIIQPNFGNK